MEKNIAGFVLTFLGGILQLIGAFFLFFSSILFRIITLGDLSELSYLALWPLLIGILTFIASANMLSLDSGKVRIWSIIALFLALLSPLNPFTLIGGIIGIVRTNK